MIWISKQTASKGHFSVGRQSFGLPPIRPLARAAASPALVRSRMRSRSNSASAPMRWKISLPPGVVVSIFSVRLIKSTPRSLRRLSVSMRSLSERPSRSSFHTITVSPERTKARSSSNPFRSNFDPVILSLKYFSHPASFKASLYNASFCSCLETRI